MKRSFSIALFLLSLASATHAQGFVNLDFESAKIISDPNSPYYPYGVATSSALPGWTASYYGSLTPITSITYNDPSAGSSWASIWATNGEQISGNYSVLLDGGLQNGISITQTGQVPVSAESIEFEAQHNGPGTFLVSLGGQYLSFSAIGTGTNYTLYAANISSFAGQIVPLTFSAEGYGITLNYDNVWNIDNISFSSTPAPEPRVWALTALGGLLFACRRCRKPLTFYKIKLFSAI